MSAGARGRAGGSRVHDGRQQRGRQLKCAGASGPGPEPAGRDLARPSSLNPAQHERPAGHAACTLCPFCKGRARARAAAGAHPGCRRCRPRGQTRAAAARSGGPAPHAAGPPAGWRTAGQPGPGPPTCGQWAGQGRDAHSFPGVPTLGWTERAARAGGLPACQQAGPHRAGTNAAALGCRGCTLPWSGQAGCASLE